MRPRGKPRRPRLALQLAEVLCELLELPGEDVVLQGLDGLEVGSGGLAGEGSLGEAAGLEEGAVGRDRVGGERRGLRLERGAGGVLVWEREGGGREVR